MNIIHELINGPEQAGGYFNLEDKKLRNSLSEQQIDKMVEDTFPASDPPSTY